MGQVFRCQALSDYISPDKPRSCRRLVWIHHRARRQVKIFCPPTKNRLVCGGLNTINFISSLKNFPLQNINCIITLFKIYTWLAKSLNGTWKLSYQSLEILKNDKFRFSNFTSRPWNLLKVLEDLRLHHDL